jgi:hypothetical protein
MTSITLTSTPPEAAPARNGLSRPVTRIGLAVVSALVVAGISLRFTHAIGNDPEAWIVWAREAAGPGILQTSGPSWKPLPVILIAPFTLISRGEADVYYWLLVTRAGAVLAVIGCASLARRAGGPAAAALTALLIVLSPWWFYNAILGNAEPLMVALIVGAVLAAEAEREAWAALALVLAALVRPELIALAVALGLGCVLTGPHRGRRAVCLTLGAGVVLLGWLVPSLIHSGLGAGTVARASTPTPGAAKNAAIPFLAVYRNTFTELTPVPGILAGVAVLAMLASLLRAAQTGVAAVIAALSRPPAVAALFGLAWVTVVAVMAQAGFPGNSRYLVPGLAALVVCAAIEATRLTARLRAPAALTVGVIAASALAISSHTLHLQLDVATAHTHEVARMRSEIGATPCAGERVTAIAADVTTLAQITDQSIAQTTPPRGMAPAPGRLVSCAPARR